MTTFNKTMLFLCSLGLAIGSTAPRAQACGDCSHSPTQTRIIQNLVEIAPVVRPGVAISTAEPVARSNYDARLGHLLEQINLASARRWLTPEQTLSFQQWQAQLVQAETIMRAADGGILSGANADQMER